MRWIIAIAFLLACLMCLGQAKREPDRHIVLPNLKLLRCTSPECYQLWQDEIPTQNVVYPDQVRIELGNGACPYGVAARYNKSVSFNELKAAIESRYGEGEYKHWTAAPLMIWRVGSDVSIQLETVDKRMAKLQRVEMGTNNIHYTFAQAPTPCGH